MGRFLLFLSSRRQRRRGARVPDPLLPATSGARAATGGSEERCPAAGVDLGNREILASEVARMIRSIKELRHYDIAARDGSLGDVHAEIGRASWRERVGQSVWIPGVPV